MRVTNQNLHALVLSAAKPSYEGLSSLIVNGFASQEMLLLFWRVMLANCCVGCGRSIAEACVAPTSILNLFEAIFWRAAHRVLMLKFVTHSTEPRVGQCLVQSDALLWLFDQQAEDQVLALLRVI